MITKEQAAELLDINTKTLSRFDDIEDPYNMPNTLSGYVSHQADYRYGALVIDTVNGEETKPQLIFGIPKIKYPFSVNDQGVRVYRWGTIKRVEAYMKFDGTNVTAYRYRNAQDAPYSTYKLRLYPVMRDNRFAPLKTLWDVCLSRWPSLQKACQDLPANFFPSFEMYGYKNPHMVKYEEDITFMHLCMIGQGSRRGELGLPYMYDFVNTNIPVAKMETGKELTEFYELMRQQAHEKNKGKTEYGDLENEGYVMYAEVVGQGFVPFKIKPEEVETISWSRFLKLDAKSIESTFWNAFEHLERVPSEKDLLGLLSEEYSCEVLDNNKVKIQSVFRELISSVELYEKVQSVCKTLAIDLQQKHEKTYILRLLSGTFPGHRMRAVYQVLLRFGHFQ